MHHRGPNYQAFHRYPMNGKEITLGHARLSILDLDARSNQPFEYNERIKIVFNGEIYNYPEIQRDYLKDVTLRTTSDTEVICAMYEKYGTKCVDYFNGMFAFVILDTKQNRLFGARDRLGKKPFYYRWNDKGFEFASQPEPIHIGNDFTINDTARKLYLHHGYISEPYCIWNELSKLRAGQYFVYDIATNQLNIDTYWDIFSNTCAFTQPKSYEEAKEVVSQLLDDAVKIRLRADVPVGMFLSGGIDSTLTSALVAKNNGKITAYTIGFEDKKYNEADFARDTAEYLHIPFETKLCSDKDMLEMFQDLPMYYDEPFGDSSSIPTSLLAKVTRQNVTVAIGGDGGDELFCGYSAYRKLQEKRFMYNLIPHRVGRLIYGLSRSQKLEILNYRNIKELHAYRYPYGGYGDASLLNVEELCKDLPDLKYFALSRGLLAASDYDMKHYLNSDINVKTDRASMRYSLELRSPLMDYRLAEYSRLLPWNYLHRNGEGKSVLRDILYQYVPKNMMDRPKHGFGAPVSRWFRDSLREDFLSTLNNRDITEWLPELDAAQIIKYAQNLTASSADTLSGNSFFVIYSYLKWCKMYVR
jgi:asparagine synthase (glutamine-hydrolysing)